MWSLKKAATYWQSTEEVSELIQSRIKNFSASSEAKTQGTVVSVTDGIVRIHGLSNMISREHGDIPCGGIPSFRELQQIGAPETLLDYLIIVQNLENENIFMVDPPPIDNPLLV